MPERPLTCATGGAKRRHSVAGRLSLASNQGADELLDDRYVITAEELPRF